MPLGDAVPAVVSPAGISVMVLFKQFCQTRLTPGRSAALSQTVVPNGCAEECPGVAWDRPPQRSCSSSNQWLWERSRRIYKGQGRAVAYFKLTGYRGRRLNHRRGRFLSCCGCGCWVCCVPTVQSADRQQILLSTDGVICYSHLPLWSVYKGGLYQSGGCRPRLPPTHSPERIRVCHDTGTIHLFLWL